MRVEESIVIDRPPEQVFEFLSVRTNDPVWMASVIESEWLDPSAPMGVGRRGRMVMRAMGRREFLDEVTDYEPGRRIAHRSGAGAMAIRTACITEPAGSGCRASVLYEPERLPGGVVGRLAAPLTARIVRRNVRLTLPGSRTSSRRRRGSRDKVEPAPRGERGGGVPDPGTA